MDLLTGFIIYLIIGFVVSALAKRINGDKDGDYFPLFLFWGAVIPVLVLYMIWTLLAGTFREEFLE
jgi:ABC-type lipoprotein release transport system permease subunit